MSPLRRAVFRARAAVHVVGAVWAGSSFGSAAGPELEPLLPERELRPEQLLGVVERFDRDRITGWLSVPAGRPPVQVALWVNLRPVASVVASVTADAPARSTWQELRSFAFGLSDVWAYVRASDRMSVRVHGRQLPISGCGLYRPVGADGSPTPQDLPAALRAGRIFDAEGRLTPARN